MQRLLEHLETLWDRVQVEHKGSYSVERMQSVKKYSEETSLVRALSVLIFTPIPCLVAVLCTDCFKLASPAEGVSHSQLLWLRTAMVDFFISWTQIKRCHRFVTGLPETPVFDLAASWALALSTTGFLWVLALSIDFPLPFASLVGGIGWWTLAVPLFFIRFGSFVRASPEISHQTKLFTWSIVSEMNTVSLYSVYTVVFVGLGVNEQIAFSLLLPIMKIASKNITRRLFQHKEDLIPEVVVFTTEMFHSLFLVIFLQNSRSIGTTFVLMAVDVACSLLAIRDVQTILDRNIERCATAYAAKSGIPMVVRSLLPVAAYILNKPDVTVHESGIRLLSEASQLFVIRPTQVAPIASALQSLATPDSKQQETRESTLSWMRPAITTEERAFADSLSKQDQRLIVRDILKLLHLTEFLLLIEFVEIVVPVVYLVFMNAAFHLPNRMYYVFLMSATQQQLDRTMRNVLIYAALELMSLIGLSVVLQRKLRLATIHQLAFVLEKNWVGVQSRLVFWVVYIVEGSLVHYGADFTFKFAWLHESHPLAL